MATTSPFFCASSVAALAMAALLSGAISAADGSEASTDTVSGRYRVWWSQGTDDPPFAPLPSCAQFFPDGRVRLGFCPFSFDGNVLSNQRTRWTAVTPCIDNLIQILWIGSSFDASDIDPQFPDVISAVGTRVDLVNGDSFAFQGSVLRNDGRSIATADRVAVAGPRHARRRAPIAATAVSHLRPAVIRHRQPAGLASIFVDAGSRQQTYNGSTEANGVQLDR